MTFENLKASAVSLMDEVERRPADPHVVQARLRAKMAEFKAFGQPVPSKLKSLYHNVEEEMAEAMFDNVPV